jgi:gliding motility-associated-like protein
MNRKVILLAVLSSALFIPHIFARDTHSLSLKTERDNSFANKKYATSVAPVANFTASTTTVCAGQKIQFTDLSTNNPTSWNWTFGGGMPPTSTVQNPLIQYSTPGTYSVKLVVSNGTGSDSITMVNYIVVNPLPVVTVTGNNTICSDSSTVLTASGAVNYRWAPSSGLSCTLCASPSVSPTITTVYTIIGFDNNGCSNATTDTVNVIPTPIVTIGTYKVVCPDVPVTFTASGFPSGGTYLWQPGNVTGQSIVDTPSKTTLFTVAYTTPCGTVTDTVSVLVAPIPSVSINAYPRRNCAPLCTQFTAVSIPASIPITGWMWSFGDDSTSTQKDPSHCYQKPGVYTVMVTAYTTQCSTTPEIQNFITVYPNPQAAFSYSPDPATIINPLISFTNQSTDSNRIISYLWTFGDGLDSTSTLENPTYTYQDTGTFCPKLTVTDIHGCIDSTTQCLDIGTEYTFYIPSAFSPNGDGDNDIFIPEGGDVKDFEMYIFDRWGMQLYHTTSMSEGWNGSVQNRELKICQEDVYVYVITVTDTKGTVHHYNGIVTLVK